MKKILGIVLMALIAIFVVSCDMPSGLDDNKTYVVEYRSGYDGRAYFEIVDEVDSILDSTYFELVGLYEIYMDNGTAVYNLVYYGEYNVYKSGNMYYIYPADEE